MSKLTTITILTILINACMSPQEIKKQRAIKEPCPTFGNIIQNFKDHTYQDLIYVMSHNNEALGFPKSIVKDAYNIDNKKDYDEFLSIYQRVCGYSLSDKRKGYIPYHETVKKEAAQTERLNKIEKIKIEITEMETSLSGKISNLKNIEDKIKETESKLKKMAPTPDHFLIVGEKYNKSNQGVYVWGNAIPDNGNFGSAGTLATIQGSMLLIGLNDSDYMTANLIRAMKMFFVKEVKGVNQLNRTVLINVYTANRCYFLTKNKRSTCEQLDHQLTEFEEQQIKLHSDLKPLNQKKKELDKLTN